MKKYIREFYDSMRSSIPLILLLVVASAVCGFVYEVLFYRIDQGRWINRGTTFGPWIPIYAIGGLLMAFSTFKLRQNRHPILKTLSETVEISESTEILSIYHYQQERQPDMTLIAHTGYLMQKLP